MKHSFLINALFALIFIPFSANATLIGFSVCGGGAVSCEITNTPPNSVTPDPNDGILLSWNEVQKVTLTGNLHVDRVANEAAPYVGSDSNGLYLIPGTIVSSHYVQWDSLPGSLTRANATIQADSVIMALITSDQYLSDSDASLGLPGIDYTDFFGRGLESDDIINFSGNAVDIDWETTSPGDWARMITITAVPIPASVWLFGSGLLGLVGIARRKA